MAAEISNGVPHSMGWAQQAPRKRWYLSRPLLLHRTFLSRTSPFSFLVEASPAQRRIFEFTDQSLKVHTTLRCMLSCSGAADGIQYMQMRLWTHCYSSPLFGRQVQALTTSVQPSPIVSACLALLWRVYALQSDSLAIQLQCIHLFTE